MIALAIRTGIAPDVWAEQGQRAIDTAIELLSEDQGDRHDADGRQMRG